MFELRERVYAATRAMVDAITSDDTEALSLAFRQASDALGIAAWRYQLTKAAEPLKRAVEELGYEYSELVNESYRLDCELSTDIVGLAGSLGEIRGRIATLDLTVCETAVRDMFRRWVLDTVSGDSFDDTDYDFVVTHELWLAGTRKGDERAASVALTRELRTLRRDLATGGAVARAAADRALREISVRLVSAQRQPPSPVFELAAVKAALTTGDRDFAIDCIGMIRIFENGDFRIVRDPQLDQILTQIRRLHSDLRAGGSLSAAAGKVNLLLRK